MVLVEIAFTLIVLGTTYIIAKPLALLWHELGHALAALLISKERVTVIIGNQENAMHLSISKRFQLFIDLKARDKGFCHYAKSKLSLQQQLYTVSAGPLASLAFISLALFLMTIPIAAGLIGKMVLAIFIYTHLRIFLLSTLPSSHLISKSGTFVSDGSTIINLFRELKNRHEKIA